MTFIQRHSAYTTKALLLTVLVLFVGACGKDTPDVVPTANEAYWKESATVGAATGSSAIIITGAVGTTWHAEMATGAAWCSFKSGDFTGSTTKEGVVKDGLNVLYVYYKANTEANQRQAQVSFTFTGTAAQSLDLIQLSASQNDLPHFDVWAELPNLKENTDYQYVTHYAQVNNYNARNFSLCFDKTKKAALWVAYPIHAVYLGSSGRTDAWAFDPMINSTYQANCVTRSYRGNYDRGHQMASADRQANKEVNAQTFYMSNMTPQLDRLNQDMWAKLESKVRSYNCSDTLYVVTGAYFGAGYTTTTDGAGNTVPIPTHYYKVLLRTKSGSTGKAIKNCSDSELISIGFWAEQKSYGNIQPPTSICMSVADIEKNTGFTFFPQVSATVKQQKNPGQWGIN
ncbi:MAG: DNA/RNA non-specific endonuclease [Alistipes sp.]